MKKYVATQIRDAGDWFHRNSPHIPCISDALNNDYILDDPSARPRERTRLFSSVSTGSSSRVKTFLFRHLFAEIVVEKCRKLDISLMLYLVKELIFSNIVSNDCSTTACTFLIAPWHGSLDSPRGWSKTFAVSFAFFSFFSLLLVVQHPFEISSIMNLVAFNRIVQSDGIESCKWGKKSFVHWLTVCRIIRENLNRIWWKFDGIFVGWKAKRWVKLLKLAINFCWNLWHNFSIFVRSVVSQ